eukprot:Pgem_evm1s14062
MHESFSFFATPLFAAVALNNIQAVKLLLEHSDIDVNKSGRVGFVTVTPLNYAKRKNYTQCFELLITKFLE